MHNWLNADNLEDFANQMDDLTDPHNFIEYVLERTHRGMTLADIEAQREEEDRLRTQVVAEPPHYQQMRLKREVLPHLIQEMRFGDTIARTPTVPHLRVATVNIGNCNAKITLEMTLRNLAAFKNRHAIDVLAIQETGISTED